MHTPRAQIGCVGLSCVCVVMQAPQSKSVSQDEVISFVRELEAIDPDYHPPDTVADVLRCSFICACFAGSLLSPPCTD